ncbi:MAG: arginase family protein [Halobacteriaceae archaeon]
MPPFPGATADRDAADYVIVGAPLDVSTTFQPGTRFGPRRIRHYAEPFDDYDHHTDQRFTDLAVHDAGDVRPWDDVSEYLEYLAAELRADDAVPLLLGGEHTVSRAGVDAVTPDVYVTVDAHLDLRDEYDGNPDNHATVTRRILESVDRAVVLGARTGNAAEWDRATDADVDVVPPAEVPNWSPDFDDESVYLSVDVDAVDPGAAPGTGTMEPFGLDPHAVRDLVTAVAPQATGFDVVEVNDRDSGQTAALAAKLLRRFVYTHAATAYRRNRRA